MATNYNYFGNLVTSGLVLDLDAAKLASYPGTGTTWYDISGNGNNVTLINGPTFTGTGKQAAITFDGVDDYSTGSIFVTPTFSFNFWLKPQQVKDYTPVFGINTWGNFIWHTTSNGSIYCGTDVNSRFTPSSAGCGAGTVALNITQNYTYTFTSGTGSLYKNGTLLVTSNNHQTPVSSSTYQSLFIANALGSNYAACNVYSTQIYNRALSATEITQNFNALRGRYGI
jgi:hypothetical protein